MGITRVGDWRLARRILSTGAARFKVALDKAVLQEAHYFRRKAVEGLREQAPGGKQFKLLSPMTLAIRRFRGFRGTKALIVRGDLRNSVTVQRAGYAAAFAGVLRSARGRDGRPLVNVAELNEFGSRPIIIPVTPKMRAFLAAALGGLQRGGGGGGGGGPGVIVVRIPPRPFMRPVAEKYFKPDEVRRRFLARVGVVLGGDFGLTGYPIPD